MEDYLPLVVHLTLIFWLLASHHCTYNFDQNEKIIIVLYYNNMENVYHKSKICHEVHKKTSPTSIECGGGA